MATNQSIQPGRRSVSKKQSKSYFRKTAGLSHKLNRPATQMRGGIRL